MVGLARSQSVLTQSTFLVYLDANLTPLIFFYWVSSALKTFLQVLVRTKEKAAGLVYLYSQLFRVIRAGAQKVSLTEKSHMNESHFLVQFTPLMTKKFCWQVRGVALYLIKSAII